MKTTKISTTFVILNLILLMSMSLIAAPYTLHTGDNVKAAVKNQISNSKSNFSEKVSSKISEMEFSYLRFDVANFTTGNETTLLPVNAMDYLRFDVNNYINTTETYENEIPVENEFEYLRFDVNKFAESDAANPNDLVESEIDYLRFDVSKYSTETPSTIDEL